MSALPIWPVERPSRPASLAFSLGSRLGALVLSLVAMAGLAVAQVQPGVPVTPQGPAVIDLGLPSLPPVTADSPRDSLIFADRFEYEQDDGAGRYQGLTTPTVVEVKLLPAVTGTGFNEFFQYQLPVGYDPQGPPVPMIIAYHGFGVSWKTPAIQSTVDDEANLRGWIYMSPNGIDDKVFGTPISQRNVEAAIDYMMTNFNVDADRLYMVGFSMGGGVVTNFAARHRDPNGLMIAALGTVSCSADWTMEWAFGDSMVHNLMLNPANFGGSPTQQPFRYQQASTIVLDPLTYPPLTPAVLEAISMGTNLGSVPTYMTWDLQDTIPRLPPLNTALAGLLSDLGTTLTSQVVDGTIHPVTGEPATHSWIVLDEVALFDFLEPYTAQRLPANLRAQQDLGGPVSWMVSSQATPSTFTYLAGESDGPGASLQISDVANSAEVVVDASAAGVQTMPVHVTASGAPGEEFQLRLTGFSQSPSYLLDTVSGDLRPGVDSDPLTGSLIVTVPADESLDVQVVHEPSWSGVLTVTPSPVALGSSAVLSLDGPVGAVSAWFFVGFIEQIFVVKGLTMGVNPTPPGFLVEAVPVDALGDLSFPIDVPVIPELAGLRVPIQALFAGTSLPPMAASNAWAFRTE